MRERGATDDPGAARIAAFTGLADRQLAASYRLAAVLLGSEVEAEDAVQDAAVQAWDRFASLRDAERFEPWFQRILVNGCRDRLRRRGRIRTLPLDDAPEPSRAFPATRLAERDALRRVLGDLPAGQREVVVLHYFGGFTLDEVAERTGERPGTVRSRLHAALEALHAAYDAADRADGGASR
ncbi:MAG: sigma-70 family RNA polymerase sigma factor [Chloroflexi bacterium]|nr:sigma-70 family RNA polymerase sigma factor [Chloroflexota bacterium]